MGTPRRADLDNALATYNQTTENRRLAIDGEREVEVEKTQQKVELIDANIGAFALLSVPAARVREA